MSTKLPLITDTFEELVDKTAETKLHLGLKGSLNTNEDSDFVGAINELEVGIRGTSNNLVATDLNTSANDLVAAVNELHTQMGVIPDSDGKGNLTNDRIGESIRSLDSAVGDATSLTTTDKTDVVSAVNELDAELGTITAGAMGTTASTVSGAIAELEAEIDTLNTFVEPSQSLNTDATTLADAINELHDSIGSGGLTTTAQTLVGAINEHDTELGAAVLSTSANTVRGAINELHVELGAIPDSNGSGNLRADRVGQSIRLLDSAVGNLNQFNTDGTIGNRTSLVTAINSLADDIAVLDVDQTAVNSRLGSLNLLDSDGFVGTERDNFVNALNALRADIPLIYDENGTQLN